jgi:DNA polymerase-3 subunit alpha
MQSLPCYKSHYSLGKSILTLEKPTGSIDNYPTSIFDLVLHSKKDFLCLVEDNMTSFLEASKNCQENKLKLMFGLRLDVTKDIENQDEKSLKNRAKYIIFANNNDGYKALIKIWSLAAREGFYYNPCIDFKNLKNLWNKNLTLVVPFYDSFLHLNSLEGYFHVPEFDSIKPKFFIENNNIPFDAYLKSKVEKYCKDNGFDSINSQSIYYKSKSDFIAYMTFKCISERRTIEKPEFNHLCSDSFNYESWLRREEKV